MSWRVALLGFFEVKSVGNRSDPPGWQGVSVAPRHSTPPLRGFCKEGNRNARCYEHNLRESGGLNGCNSGVLRS